MDLTKIKSLDIAEKKVSELRAKNRKIVLCYGLFHFLHIGHIRYLKEAKEYGDVLIVGVCSDKFIAEDSALKFEENLRAEAISSLEWVDMIVVNPFEDVYQFVGHIRPDFFVRGFEYKDNCWLQEDRLDHERLQNLGVDLIVLEEENFVSTSRINRYIGNISDVVQNYLHFFKRRFSINEVVRTVERMQDLRVLVVGDTILDEYQYCSAIGKSSKDPMLALKYESHDLFAGGVLAVANHLAGFVEKVDLITTLGEKKNYEEFIRSELSGNVVPTFLLKPAAPTLMKRRFVDGYSMSKLFEVYIMDDSEIEGEVEDEFCRCIKRKLSEYDLIVSADFGHGTISAKIKRLLSEEAPYLAVNAQSNAGNRGFNNITKYSHADYVSIAEHEIRTEMRDLSGKLRGMMETLMEQMGCRHITVTRGRHGCMVLDRKGGFVQVPSFASTVVDRVGAGDALFAVTSLSAVQNAPSELVGFLGSVAGSLAVEIMGNQKSIKRRTATDFIHQLIATGP